MKALSATARTIRPSVTLSISALAAQLRAEGRDVVDLSIGEPDFATPEPIKEAGVAAIEKNKTHYTPAQGTLELRRAISHRVEEELGVYYPEEQILVSSGAKHCLYLALRALVDPGEEVIFPTPGYVSYREMISMAGGIPVEVPTTWEERFKLTGEKLQGAVTERTKAVILNSPCNPTGMVYHRRELEDIVEVCIEKDLYIISDEIYSSLIYGEEGFCSLASLGERVRKRLILVNGVSKAYAMTGWRIGYALAQPEVAQAMAGYASHSTGSPCTISQWAATAALAGDQKAVGEMREQFRLRRDEMLARLRAIPQVRCLCPEGAFYHFLDVRPYLGRPRKGSVFQGDEELAAALLQEAGVAVVPGSGFGGAGHLRLSYAASLEQIDQGMDRLENFFRGFDEERGDSALAR